MRYSLDNSLMGCKIFFGGRTVLDNLGAILPGLADATIQRLPELTPNRYFCILGISEAGHSYPGLMVSGAGLQRHEGDLPYPAQCCLVENWKDSDHGLDR